MPTVFWGLEQVQRSAALLQSNMHPCLSLLQAGKQLEAEGIACHLVLVYRRVWVV